MVKAVFFSVAWCGVSILAMVFSPVASSAFPAPAWQEVESEHFVIRHQRVPSEFIQEVLRAAEAHYRRSMTTLGFTRYKGWTWSRRARITVYASRKDYIAASHHGWSGGQVNPATKEIATFPSDSGFFDALLPHELGHIIFREAAGFHDNIPLWLDEGVAMYQQRARSITADAAVRDLIVRGKYIPLAALQDMALGPGTDKETVSAFYHEAGSLVGFLIRKYEVYRFERLCRELHKGSAFTAALNKAYMQFDNLAALEKAWRRYLDEKD